MMLQSENQSCNRILVVDDEPHVRSAMVHALSLLGYQAAEAASGAQALAQLAKDRYDAILLDIHMPDMSGVEVMQAVRSRNLDTAIVVLTGHGSLESAIAAIHSHVAEYLLKPASIADIRNALAAVLGQRTREQQTQQLLKTIEEAVEGLHAMDGMAPGLAPALPEQFLQVGSLLLDRQHRIVMHTSSHSHTVTLSESEAYILATLMRQPGQLLTCRQLAATLDYDVEEYEAEELVRPHISRLRQHLHAIPGAAQMIHTIRGRGYQFSPA